MQCHGSPIIIDTLRLQSGTQSFIIELCDQAKVRARDIRSNPTTRLPLLGFEPLTPGTLVNLSNAQLTELSGASVTMDTESNKLIPLSFVINLTLEYLENLHSSLASCWKNDLALMYVSYSIKSI